MYRKSLFLFVLFVMFLTACGNKDYKEAMLNGDKAIEEEEYEKAITYFEEALTEKENDKVGSNKLEKTKQIVSGLQQLNDSNFDEATSIFQNLLNDNDAKFLHDKVEYQLELTQELEQAYQALNSFLDDIEKLEEKGKYEEALSMIDNVLEEDFSHPSIASLKKAIKSKKTDLTEEQSELETTLELANKTISETKSLIDKGKYDDALSLINETLEQDFNHHVLKPLEKELNVLQGELNDSIKKIENSRLEQELINRVIGFWQEESYENDICEITRETFSCYIFESDVGFIENINSWHVDIDNEVVIVDFPGSSEWLEPISVAQKDRITIEGRPYKRVSEAVIEELARRAGAMR